MNSPTPVMSPTGGGPVTRRTLLVSAGAALFAGGLRPLAATPAAAAGPTLTYGHGYLGGY